MSDKLLRDDIEYIVHCDAKGVIIGPLSKVHAHLRGVRETLTHYSTWSMIYNPIVNKYGIQLKNPTKNDEMSAGKWDMGVAGHNCYVEEDGDYRPLSFSENLVKEAKEEIGINLGMYDSKNEFVQAVKYKPEQIHGYIFEEFHFKTDANNEWVGLGFIMMPNTKVHFEDDEVIDFKWLSPEELQLFIVQNDNYCSPLPLVFEKAEKFRKNNFS